MMVIPVGFVLQEKREGQPKPRVLGKMRLSLSRGYRFGNRRVRKLHWPSNRSMACYGNRSLNVELKTRLKGNVGATTLALCQGLLSAQ